MKRNGRFEIFQRKARMPLLGFAARARARARSELWYGRFRAANGKIQWRTSEGYGRRRDVIKAIQALAPYTGMVSCELVRYGKVWQLTRTWKP